MYGEGKLSAAADAFRRSMTVVGHSPGAEPLNIEEIRAATRIALADKRIHREAVLEPGELGGIGGTWVRNSESGQGMSIVHFHGGGYVCGKSEDFSGFASWLGAAFRSDVFLPDYRLAPETPYPAALEDAVAVANVAIGGGQRILISGDSAGGGLALAAACALRDRGMPEASALYLISPWTDLTLSGKSNTRSDGLDIIDPSLLPRMADWYANSLGKDSTGISPLFGDLSCLPPIVIQVGGGEVLLDDSVRLSQRIAEAGGSVVLQVWRDLFHIWPIFSPKFPEAEQALRCASVMIDSFNEGGR